MTNTFGVGITISATIPIGFIPGAGVDGGVQTSFVRDGATGTWYFVKTYIAGPALSVLPADISGDVFVLREGKTINDLTGPGSIFIAAAGASAAAIRNGDGDLIGIGTGVISNIGVGTYLT